MSDGVNTTDTVTGTFGNNLNFEAIAEVVVRTAGVSAEFGRSTGAYVDVITKSGTNQLSGSFKMLAINDHWDQQNSTKSEVARRGGTFASLARTQFNKVNKTFSFTVGGPIVRNRAWFFVAYEDCRSDDAANAAQRASRPDGREFPAGTGRSSYPNVRGTVQLTPSQNVWVKYSSDPFSGIVRNDYWAPFLPAERGSLTAQEQGGNGVAGQYTAVHRQSMDR